MTTIEDNIKNENINKINNEFEINNELNVSNIPYFYDYGYTSIVINQILEINNFLEKQIAKLSLISVLDEDIIDSIKDQEIKQFVIEMNETLKKNGNDLIKNISFNVIIFQSVISVFTKFIQNIMKNSTNIDLEKCKIEPSFEGCVHVEFIRQLNNIINELNKSNSLNQQQQIGGMKNIQYNFLFFIIIFNILFNSFAWNVWGGGVTSSAVEIPLSNIVRQNTLELGIVPNSQINPQDLIIQFGTITFQLQTPRFTDIQSVEWNLIEIPNQNPTFRKLFTNLIKTSFGYKDTNIKISSDFITQLNRQFNENIDNFNSRIKEFCSNSYNDLINNDKIIKQLFNYDGKIQIIAKKELQSGFGILCSKFKLETELFNTESIDLNKMVNLRINAKIVDLTSFIYSQAELIDKFIEKFEVIIKTDLSDLTSNEHIFIKSLYEKHFTLLNIAYEIKNLITSSTIDISPINDFNIDVDYISQKNQIIDSNFNVISSINENRIISLFSQLDFIIYEFNEVMDNFSLSMQELDRQKILFQSRNEYTERKTKHDKEFKEALAKRRREKTSDYFDSLTSGVGDIAIYAIDGIGNIGNTSINYIKTTFMSSLINILYLICGGIICAGTVGAVFYNFRSFSLIIGNICYLILVDGPRILFIFAINLPNNIIFRRFGRINEEVDEDNFILNRTIRTRPHHALGYVHHDDNDDITYHNESETKIDPRVGFIATQQTTRPYIIPARRTGATQEIITGVRPTQFDIPPTMRYSRYRNRLVPSKFSYQPAGGFKANELININKIIGNKHKSNFTKKKLLKNKFKKYGKITKKVKNKHIIPTKKKNKTRRKKIRRN